MAQAQVQASQRIHQPCHKGQMAGPTTEELPKFDSMLSESLGFEAGAGVHTFSVQSSHVSSFSEEDRY